MIALLCIDLLLEFQSNTSLMRSSKWLVYEDGSIGELGGTEEEVAASLRTLNRKMSSLIHHSLFMAHTGGPA